MKGRIKRLEKPPNNYKNNGKEIKESPCSLCIFFIIFLSIQLVRHELEGTLHIGDYGLHCLQLLCRGVNFRVFGHHIAIIGRLSIYVRNGSILIWKMLKINLEQTATQIIL